MVKGKSRVSFDGEGFGVKRNDVDSVGVVFNEATDGDAWEMTRGNGRESHGVQRVRGVIGDGVVGSEMGFLG